jgi:1,4-dihydroxy-2-naphthoate octaprenyltransferase
MGTAMAIGAQVAHVGAAVAALLGAILIQIGTNYANDYFDFVKGTDTHERIGPQRATAAGLVAPATMRTAFLLVFGLAVLVGAYLVWRAGWPIVWIGLASVACGILYTGGPKPLAYVGLGDVFVLVFFGPVATAGTWYVQALSFHPAAAFAGLGPGLLATGLLTVNNLRDIEGDRKAGKRTLAARFGARFAKIEYTLCLLGAAGVPVLLWALWDAPAGAMAAGVVCLLGIPPLRQVWASSAGTPLLPALAASGRLLVLYALAFCIGWLV